MESNKHNHLHSFPTGCKLDLRVLYISSSPPDNLDKGTYLHVFSDEPNAVLPDGDTIELDNIPISGCKLQNADLCQECLLCFLITLVQHLDGHFLHKLPNSVP